MIGSNVFVYASSDVRIGKDSALGSGVKVYTEVQDFFLLNVLGCVTLKMSIGLYHLLR